MPKAARLGDIASGHGCFPPSPITSGSGDVFINGIPAARVGDSAAPHGCKDCPPHGRNIAAGSATVFINGRPASRIGDAISCGGSISAGSGNVFIGDQGSAGLGSISAIMLNNTARTFDELPQAICSKSGEVIYNLPYFIACPDGRIFKGRTDSEGLTQRVSTDKIQKLKVYWGDEALAKQDGVEWV